MHVQSYREKLKNITHVLYKVVILVTEEKAFI